MSKRWLCAVALSLLTTIPLMGQPSAPGGISEALLQDATSYADQYGVGLDEAVRRLRLQNEIGTLDATLSQEEKSTFAGLWIEHEPEYRVIVRFTNPASEQRLQARLARTSLAGLVELRRAAVSLVQLEERRNIARQHARQLRFPVDSDINVFENRAEIYSDRPQALRAALAAASANLPDHVEIIAVSGLAEPTVLIGGETGNSCTGGFTVRGYNGEVGISTAAHCPNNQYYQGVGLYFRSEDQQGNQDVQWSSSCKILDVSNEFITGIGNRACTGTRTRDQQAIGAYVCKWGMTSGRTCGYIQSKSVAPSYVTSAASTFVRVNGGVTLPGDSGGPWFIEDLAYGITSGRFLDDNDGIYMPINYISSIGASVLTYNPGPGCNLPPQASVYANTWGGYAADFDASGSYDPDGSIVSYFWDFGDGTSETTSSPWTSHYYPYSGSFSITLTVTDNEGATGWAYTWVSFCNSPYEICPLQP